MDCNNYMNQYKYIYRITKETITQYKNLSIAESRSLLEAKINIFDDKKSKIYKFFLSFFALLLISVSLYILVEFIEDPNVMIFCLLPVLLYLMVFQVFLTYSISSFFNSLWGEGWKHFSCFAVASYFTLIKRSIINFVPVLLSCCVIVICSLVLLILKLKTFVFQHYAIALVTTSIIFSMLDQFVPIISDIVIFDEIVFWENGVTRAITIAVLLIISSVISFSLFEIFRLNEYKNNPFLKYKINTIAMFITTILVFINIHIMLIASFNDRSMEDRRIKEIVTEKLIELELLDKVKIQSDSMEISDETNIKPYNYIKFILFIAMFFGVLLSIPYTKSKDVKT